jgi:hypothetical protein
MQVLIKSMKGGFVMSSFNEKWHAECKKEGGRWYTSDPKEFTEKRAILADSVGFKSASKLSFLFIILSFVIPLIVVPLIMFRGAWDYLIVLAWCALVVLACFVVWKYSVKEYKLDEIDDLERGR